MAKVMISGATGLLGRALMNEFSKEHDAIGLGYSRAQPPILKVDLFDKEALHKVFAEHTPDFFIHSAAERNPDRFDNDPENSIKLNCAVTEEIARCCQQFGCKLIFISTDYVFDGRTPPYREDAATNPLNLYGESKARSEQLLQKDYPNAAIARIPVLYGEVTALKESAVTIIAEQLMKGVRAFDHDSLRFPTNTADIARVLRQAIEVVGSNLKGVYHISAKEMMTKLDMAKAMAPMLDIDRATLIAAPVDENAAPRPKDCALHDTRLAAVGIEIDAQFSDAISTILGPHLSQ
ncbi:dTDP-4-dehydrorhamnose reductase family protein [Pseudoalteromonas sp. GB56]